jgi:hypothetical protein
MSGDYTLNVGMYDPATVERLAAVGPDGGRLPEDRVVLTMVRVQPVVTWQQWAFSGMCLAATALGVVRDWQRESVV